MADTRKGMRPNFCKPSANPNWVGGRPGGGPDRPLPPMPAKLWDEAADLAVNNSSPSNGGPQDGGYTIAPVPGRGGGDRDGTR